MNKYQTEKIENYETGYCRASNAIRNKLRVDYGLTHIERDILVFIVSISQMDFKTSRKMIAEYEGYTRYVVNDAIAKLIDLGLVHEVKDGVFSRFTARIPYRYKSEKTNDAVCGRQSGKCRIFQPVSWGFTLDILPESLEYRLLSNLNSKDSPSGGKVIQEKVIKNKSKGISDEETFLFFGKEEKNKNSLLEKYNCDESKLIAVMQYYHNLYPEKKTLHVLFLSKVKIEEFETYYTRLRESQHQANREKEDSTPADLEGIKQMVSEQDDEGPIIDLENISVTPQEEALAKQAIEEMMLSLKRQMIINEVELTD